MPGHPRERSFGVGHKSSIELNLNTIDRQEYYITSEKLVDNEGKPVPDGADLVVTRGTDWYDFKRELKTNPGSKPTLKFMRFKHDPTLDMSDAAKKARLTPDGTALLRGNVDNIPAGGEHTHGGGCEKCKAANAAARQNEREQRAAPAASSSTV